MRLEHTPVYDPLSAPPRGLSGRQESPSISMGPASDRDLIGLPVEVTGNDDLSIAAKASSMRSDPVLNLHLLFRLRRRIQ
eukprot:4745215-Alexandrium_andersonii.AAC.1